MTRGAGLSGQRRVAAGEESERNSPPSRTCYPLDVSHPGLGAYKIVLYRQEDGSWVAEIPAIAGCYALMATREEAVTELARVFDMIAEEYQTRGAPLPEDTTEIVNA